MGYGGIAVNVAFFGTPSSAVPTLHALLSQGHRVSLVVTQPDRPAGRSTVPRASPVKEAAVGADLPILQPAKLRTPEFVDRVRSAAPDVLVVVAYGRILPESVLQAAPGGAINVHFSLLPRWRGAAPVQWALAKGDVVTGVTTMQMNARLDEGDILLREDVSVDPGEHAPSLTSRLSTIGAALLLETLRRIGEGGIDRLPQDPALVTYAPVLTREDGEVGPRLSAREIEGRTRGFDPWPGAWIRCDGRRIRLVEARAGAGGTSSEPEGTVLDLSEGALRIVCGGGSLLEVMAVQPEGRRVMAARDAVNGRILRPGQRIECMDAIGQ